MLTSQTSLARFLILTSGFGLGALSALRLAIWLLHLGPGADRLCGRPKILAVAIMMLALSIGLLACIYFSFQLAYLATPLELTEELAFELLTLSSLVGFAVPSFAAIVATYDWSRHYDVPALKKFGKHFALVALAAVSANIVANQFCPLVEPLICFASLLLIGVGALVRVERIKKRPDHSLTRESSSERDPTR